MIEPVNPEIDALLDFRYVKIIGDKSEYNYFERFDENDLITMQFSNATLTMRAGSLCAILGLKVE